ncbi:MAG: hypothetical protein ACK4Z6_04635 [Candidatus Methylomirabilales bacterium]
MAKLKGSYEQIDKRLGSIEERLGRLEDRIDALASEMRRQFYWTLAFIAPLYALLVGLIMQLRH